MGTVKKIVSAPQVGVPLEIKCRGLILRVVEDSIYGDITIETDEYGTITDTSVDRDDDLPINKVDHNVLRSICNNEWENLLTMSDAHFDRTVNIIMALRKGYKKLKSPRNG